MTPPFLTSNGLERRVNPTRVEFRKAPEGSRSLGTIVGYAAMFNEPSCDLGGFIERLAPGAFSGCMADDVRCLIDHKDSKIIGRASAGTLRFEEDSKGLHFECDLPDVSYARDLLVNLDLRNITGCSFKFGCDADGMTWDFAGPMPIRTLTKISRLVDVGPVTFPAYESTSVDLRSFKAAQDAHNALEDAKVQDLIKRASTLQTFLASQVLPDTPA